jgi:threonine/homoserine/homoserine lactone efflux protein
VLPQFLHSGTSVGWLLAFARTHAALSLAHLLAVTAGPARARRLLTRRAVRRGMDAVTGTVLLGFSARLATEQF